MACACTFDLYHNIRCHWCSFTLQARKCIQEMFKAAKDIDGPNVGEKFTSTVYALRRCTKETLKTLVDEMVKRKDQTERYQQEWYITTQNRKISITSLLHLLSLKFTENCSWMPLLLWEHVKHLRFWRKTPNCSNKASSADCSWD